MLLRFPASFYYLIMSFRYGLYLFYVCFKDSSPFLSVLIYYIRIFGYTIELLKYNRLWNIIVYLFIHNDTEYSFIKAMSSSLTGYALVTACRAEVTIYMKENNLKGYYILTGMAKV